ncbi:MAG: GNAT family N-acetyltransferase [Kofleriaceae bacterium]
MRLETERLVLREFVEDDWRALFAIESQPDVVRYQANDVHDEARSREYVQGIMVCAREVPRLVFDLAITRPGDDTYIGRVGMRRADADPRLGELWFVIAPEHQGHGYVTEAARALVTYAFAELGMHRIHGDCDPRNPASARVMERLGMRREGHLVQNVFLKGEWCDSLIYAVLASEWGHPPR